MLQRTVLSSPSGAHVNSLYVFNSLICTIVCMLFLLLFMLYCFVHIQQIIKTKNRILLHS